MISLVPGIVSADSMRINVQTISSGETITVEAELTDTIKNIERRNFIDSCRNTYSCHYCDLKYFCRKREITEELK